MDLVTAYGLHKINAPYMMGYFESRSCSVSFERKRGSRYELKVLISGSKTLIKEISEWLKMNDVSNIKVNDKKEINKLILSNIGDVIRFKNIVYDFCIKGDESIKSYVNSLSKYKILTDIENFYNQNTYTDTFIQKRSGLSSDLNYETKNFRQNRV